MEDGARSFLAEEEAFSVIQRVSFSPDGERLAFVARRNTDTLDERVDVYLSTLEGEVSEPLLGIETSRVGAPGAEYVAEALWIDEDTLVVVRGVPGRVDEGGTGDLYRYTLSDGVSEALTTSGRVVGRVTANASRTRVMYSELGGALFELDLATGASEPLGLEGEATGLLEAAAWWDDGPSLVGSAPSGETIASTDLILFGEGSGESAWVSLGSAAREFDVHVCASPLGDTPALWLDAR